MKRLLLLLCLSISGCFDFEESIFGTNQAPTVEELAAIRAVVGDVTQIKIMASDEEDDPLTYSLIDNPAWVSIEGNTISIAPASEHVGQLNFKVSVSDGTLSTEVNTELIVTTSASTSTPNPANQAPVVEITQPIRAAVGITTQANIVASDAEGDTLTYALIGHPAWVSIQGDIISISPLAEQVGQHSFKVRVSDSEQYTEVNVALNVFVLDTPIDPSLVNYAPDLEAIPPMTVAIRSSSQTQIVAKDPNNDVLVYRLDNPPDFVSIDQQGMLSITSPSAEGDFTFQITVSDKSFNITKPITITVNNPHYGADKDGDGIDDGVELKYGLDPANEADAFQDSDGDGLSNLIELSGKRFLLQYNAQYDGPLLDDPEWTLNTIGTRGSQHNMNHVLLGDRLVQHFRDDDGTRSSHMDLNHSLNFEAFARELYRYGGLLSFEMATHTDGGMMRLFIAPAYSGDYARRALMMDFTRMGADGLRISIVSGSTFELPTDNPAGKIHLFEIEFFGNDSYGGEMRLDGNVLQRDETNILVTRATIVEGLTFLTESVNYRGFDFYKLQFSINNPHPVTDPNSKDTDSDGIDDNVELEVGLNPLDTVDGYNVDTDGDGMVNGTEIANGFDPLDPLDHVNVDTDGDGVNNNVEIANGMDPFTADDLAADADNDGISSADELAFNLNPIDPSDGFNADSDGDGISNGVEINNNTNPNDHKLQLKDKFTIKLVVDDSNNDGEINDSDTTKEVAFERYSLRKPHTELIFFRDQPDNRYIATSDLPEVRTFRGRVVSEPDSAVYATIWEDCRISYNVFFGANAKPDFRLGPDAAHAMIFDATFDHTGVCNTTNVSEARYQRGLQANYEPVEYQADTEPPTHENYFPSGASFHMFEHPQSFQASYRTWSELGYKNIGRTLALMEAHANVGDQVLARSFYERISISDFLVEMTGIGDPNDGSTSADWDDNWGTVRSEFWVARRSEPDHYWHEHIYWNNPPGRSGIAYGQLVQAVLVSGTYIHEMGHNLGSGHQAYSERLKGTNAMGRTTLPASATIVHQNIAAPRRKTDKTGVRQHFDLRIGVPNWNFHPLAQPDHISVYRDETATIDVLANDSDANNHALKITSVTIVDDASDEGAIDTTLTITSDQKIEITPPKGFIGLIDAYYIIEDETGLSTRGILHINVEHEGISDIITYDHDCIDDPDALATVRGILGLNTLFGDRPRDTKVSVANWGFTLEYDSDRKAINVTCATHVSAAGNSNNADDKAATWGSVQYPTTNNQLRNDVINDLFEHHPHLFEINNKDFSVMFWFRPSADYTGYTVLASRGRVRDYDYDGDGWIVAANGNTLSMRIHDKSQKITDRILTLEVENVTELTDTGAWAHIAMTIDWTTRELIAYVNGQQAGKIAIPAYFSMVSSSGTMQRYGRGSYAVFGQRSGLDGDEPGIDTIPQNNGFDDLVVAHTALTANEILTIFQGKLPVNRPLPANGRSIDMSTIKALEWRPQTDIQGDIQSYNVYLSDSAAAVSPNLSTALIGSTPLTTHDVSTLVFNSTKAYYWRVDTVLNDGSIIPGEVWSFWQQKPSLQAKSFWPTTRYQLPPDDEGSAYECRGVHIDHWLNERRLE